MVNPDNLIFYFMLTYNKFQFLTLSTFQRVGWEKVISQDNGKFSCSYYKFVIKERIHSMKVKIVIWDFLQMLL